MRQRQETRICLRKLTMGMQYPCPLARITPEWVKKTKTLKMLFSEPFGQGYSKHETERKLRDTLLFKEIRRQSQIETVFLLDNIDRALVDHVLRKTSVIDFVLKNGINKEVVHWIAEKAVRNI